MKFKKCDALNFIISNQSFGISSSMSCIEVKQGLICFNLYMKLTYVILQLTANSKICYFLNKAIPPVCGARTFFFF